LESEPIPTYTLTLSPTKMDQPQVSATQIKPSTAIPTTLMPKRSPTVELARIKLTSPAFSSGSMIPSRYSRDGEDMSPPLIWGEPPDGTQSFAIVMESDPLMDGDVRWVHWVLYNIPAKLRELPEGMTPDAEGRMPDGSQHVENSWQELRYGGPKTQRFETQKYTLKIYALDRIIDPVELEGELESENWFGSAKDGLLAVIDEHILAVGVLMGKYKP
jgi:Raf kinase inhibitor-like YbhB/YbcL family protein